MSEDDALGAFMMNIATALDEAMPKTAEQDEQSGGKARFVSRLRELCRIGCAPPSSLAPAEQGRLRELHAAFEEVLNAQQTLSSAFGKPPRMN